MNEISMYVFRQADVDSEWQ